MSTYLIAFLKARLDEQEQTVRSLSDSDDCCEGIELQQESGYPAMPYLGIGKAYALADVASKRKIIARYQAFVDLQPHQIHGSSQVVPAIRMQLLSILKEMTALFADHPDYQPTWRPQ